MTLILSRRRFLVGLTSLLATPAIVRAENIMPVRAVMVDDPWVSFQSWPINEKPPRYYVGGIDLLSRAQRMCELTGGKLCIRPPMTIRK